MWRVRSSKTSPCSLPAGFTAASIGCGRVAGPREVVRQGERVEGAELHQLGLSRLTNRRVQGLELHKRMVNIDPNLRTIFSLDHERKVDSIPSAVRRGVQAFQPDEFDKRSEWGTPLIGQQRWLLSLPLVSQQSKREPAVERRVVAVVPIVAEVLIGDVSQSRSASLSPAGSPSKAGRTLTSERIVATPTSRRLPAGKSESVKRVDAGQKLRFDLE